MTDLYMTRTLSGLAPADDTAMMALRRIKIGEHVRVEMTKPRNIHFHRMFFAMLNTVWTSCGDWNSAEELLTELKFRVGHVEKQNIVDRQSGEVIAEVVTPKSISFGAMDDTQFRTFYNRCIDVICREMVPGLNDSVLRDEVLKAVGLPLREQQRA